MPIYIAAEHGAYIRDSSRKWTQLFPFDTKWKDEARKILEEFVELAPGSYVEEKESSIAWHYRNVEPELGEAVAVRLVESLSVALSGFSASIIRGNKVVEIRPAGVNKGAAAKTLLEQIKPDFILAAGDDITDEDMFKALPSTAYTIKVGRGESAAKFTVGSYRQVRQLIERLVKSLNSFD